MHERLAEVLAADIISGSVREGETFPSSDELVREFGVSRTVARETIQALMGTGLITVQHGKRSTVAGSQHWRLLDPLVQAAIGQATEDHGLILDMWETRQCVEPEAVRIGVERASDAQLHDIVTVQETLAGSVDWNSETDLPNEVARHEWTFHAAVVNACENRVLAGVVRDTHRGVLAAHSWVSISAENAKELVDQHRAIAEAIAARRTEDAVDLMSRHIAWTARISSSLVEGAGA